MRDNGARSLGAPTKPSWRPRIAPDSSSAADYRQGWGPTGGPPRQVSSTFLHDYLSVKVPPDSTVKLFKKCTCLPAPHPSSCFRKSGMNLGIQIQLTSKQGRALGHRPSTSDSRKSRCNLQSALQVSGSTPAESTPADRAALHYALTENNLSVSKKCGTVRTCVVLGSTVFQELHS